MAYRRPRVENEGIREQREMEGLYGTTFVSCRVVLFCFVFRVCVCLSVVVGGLIWLVSLQECGITDQRDCWRLLYYLLLMVDRLLVSTHPRLEWGRCFTPREERGLIAQ